MIDRPQEGLVDPSRAHSVDVLVVGAGPGGCAAAQVLAERGHRTLLVDRDEFPRDKPCGDALTPGAMSLLAGLGIDTDDIHRTNGVRISAARRVVDLPWPGSGQPSTGGIVRRSELDRRLAESAGVAGAEVRFGLEATDPIIEHGLVRGAMLTPNTGGESVPIRARFLTVADGAISRFGRSLGTARDRSHAQGFALRGYYRSPQHDLPWLESNLDLEDSSGANLPGMRWAFPMGDGTVNVGIGVLSSAQHDALTEPEELLARWIDELPRHWEIDADCAVGEPVGGRLPLGGSVHPRCGPNWLVVGDAAGSASPFSGDGIEAALRTGRQAALAISQALDTNDGTALRQYDRSLDEESASHYKVGRLVGRVLGQPGAMREVSRLAVHNQAVIEWLFRLANNEVDPGERSVGGRTFRLAERLAGWVPER